MERIGDTRDEYTELFDVYWPIGVAVFLVIAALVVYVVLRFRSRSAELPRGRDTSKAEDAWAAFVGLIVAALLYLTFDTMSDIEASERAARGPLVEVTAAKWSWRFDYPGGVTVAGNDRRPPTLVVPADTAVRFRLTSLDVIHSFWIADRRFKRDAFPSRTTTFALLFPEPGFMREGGQCNQFCGLLHSEMKFHVDVREPADFRRWLARRRTGERS